MTLARQYAVRVVLDTPAHNPVTEYCGIGNTGGDAYLPRVFKKGDLKTMRLRFYVNDEIDMTKVTDSMMLDSNQVIAEMEMDGISASLEVRGEVKVWWNETGDPMDGDYHIHPSEFPDSLKELIAKGHAAGCIDWTLDPRLYISENNWFELFVSRTGDPSSLCITDVVDAEGSTVYDLFQILYDAIEKFAGL